MGREAAIVEAATWTAVLAASYLAALAFVVISHSRPLLAKGALGAGLIAAVVGCGVAAAVPGAGHRHRTPDVSAAWPGRGPGPARAVVVHPGDCLWAIAARHLDRPTPSRVADAWPRWWRTNVAVVGRDPNVIQPGQRLRPPAPVRSRS